MSRALRWTFLAGVVLSGGATAPAAFEYVWAEIVASHGDSTTYRVYAHFSDPADRLLAVYGLGEHPFVLTTQTRFLNDGGDFAGLIEEDTAAAPFSGPFDSWFTIAADELAGNDTAFTPNFADGDGVHAVLRDRLLVEVNGGWFDFNPSTPALPDGAGDILIAQLTTDCAFGCWEMRGMVAWDNGTQGLSEAPFQYHTCDPDLTSPCLWDLERDGAVDLDDLVILLTRWAPCDCCGCPCRDADFDGDLDVDFDDLVDLLFHWGACELL